MSWNRLQQTHRICLLAICMHGFWSAANAQSDEPVLMNEVMEAAIQSFSSGDYDRAARLFERLHSDFGREPELRKVETRKVLLPAQAYATYATENYDAAIQFFNQFLEEFPEPGPTHAFSLYTLAQAYQLNEQSKEASNTLSRFTEAYPNSPEAQLAILQRADILFRSGELEDALALSDEFYASEASSTLRTQARLRALQILVDEGRFEEAGEILRGTQWRVTVMPELAVLTFAALQTGDAAMVAEDFETALYCYHLVPPYEELLDRQIRQLELAERILNYRRTTDQSPMATVWNRYYEQLVQRLRSQLNSLEAMENYMPSFQLRRGRAFLQAGREYEAWIIFRALTGDASLSPEIRQQAHYLWVLTAYALDRWEETLRINEEFQMAYPDSELSPNATYLVAQAYQEQGNYRRATKILSNLWERYPDHALAPRWLYTRGFNRAMMEEYDTAREDFTLLVDTFGEHPLWPQSALWHALTHLFEKNYEIAMEELLELEETFSNHPLHPEIFYRIATVHYAERNYDRAMEQIDAFLESFPLHTRVPEAKVLRGDILMGKGRLTEAAAAFAEVTPEAEGLFPYAVFQRGKIFQALERYDLMIRHFESYLTRENLPSNARISEALYWLGWALIRESKPEAALDAYDAAILSYGNRIDATEVTAIIAAMESLRTDLLRQSSDAQLPEHPLLEAVTFQAWLVAQQEKAIEDKQGTWFSRLKFHEVQRARGRGNDSMAQTLLMEIDEKVGMDEMDPDVIAEIGLVYADFPAKYAGDYFDYISEHYPDHPARAVAWFGNARLAFEEDRIARADGLLRRFEREIPLHPLSSRVKILRGRIFTLMKEFDEAEKRFEEVLQLRQARGILHARALAGLAEMNEAKGNLQRAIPYWQRIYTLYRAYPELVAEAYYKSSLLFDQIGETESAQRSLTEMLSDDRLLTSPYAEKANQKLREIIDRKPEPETQPEMSLHFPPSNPVAGSPA